MPSGQNERTESLEAALDLLEKDGLLPPDIARQLVAKLQRLDQLEAEFSQALERAKLAALKELAYGASHEINNPLANIATRGQALLADETHPERKRKLATIVAQAFRAHEMISDLMLFAKPPPLTPALVLLSALLSQVVAECRETAVEQGTAIELQVGPTDLHMEADGTHLAVAVKALIRNALEALEEGGNVRVAVRESDGQIVLEVTDDGPGISAEVRPHIFEPFYSGREAGRGLGFGLPKCWRIVELHGGRMEVESQAGQGTTIRMILPPQQPA